MRSAVSAVVIDNELPDIIGVSHALNSRGIASFPIHYTDPTAAGKLCADCAQASPRIIITDIQMNDGGAKPSKTDLANVVRCISSIVCNMDGPYIVLAWTSVPESFDELSQVLHEYFKKKNIRVPFYFGSISKNECKVEGVGGYDYNKIFSNLENHLEENNRVKAVLHWEGAVLSAANETVNDLLGVLDVGSTKILHQLAVGVAGKNLEGYESVAVNESFSYLLRDKLSQSSISDSSKDIWRKAFSEEFKGKEDVSRSTLNYLLHVDKNPSEDIICPGDLWLIENWEQMFSSFCASGGEIGQQVSTFRSQFYEVSGRKNNLVEKLDKEKDVSRRQKIIEEIAEGFEKPELDFCNDLSLVAMEISPLCDFSNKKKPLKTVVLGVMAKKDGFSSVIKRNLKSESIIIFDCDYNDEPCVFMFSSMYLFSFSEDFLQDNKNSFSKIIRFRESITQSWIHRISSYNSRIGTVSF